MTNDGKKRLNISATVASGAGIGLLVGSLIGLSLSPVVGTVVGALAALLAAFLGLTDQQFLKANESDKDAAEDDRLKREYRAASFGFSCTIGVIFGLVLRTHNYLGESLSNQYQNLIDIGFTEDQSRKLVVYREYNLLPDGLNPGDAEPPAIRRDVGGLYSALSENCVTLDPQRYSDVDETLHAWSLQEDEHLKTLTAKILTLPSADDRRDLVNSIWSLECAQN